MKPNEQFHDQKDDTQNPATQTQEVVVVPVVDIGQTHIDVAKQAIRKCQGQVNAILEKYKDFKKPAVDSPDFKQRLKEIDADRKSLKNFRIAAVKDHEDYKKPALVYCTEIDKDLREYKAIIEPGEDMLSKMHAELESDQKRVENEKRNTRIKALVDVGFELSEGNYVLLDRKLEYSELLKASDATIKSLVDFGTEIQNAKKAKQDELDAAKAELDAQKKALDEREAAILKREMELGLIVKPSEPVANPGYTQQNPVIQEPIPNPEYTQPPKEIVVSANIPAALEVVETGNVEVKVLGIDVDSFIKGFEQFRTAMMIAIEEDRFQSEADLMNFVVNCQPEIKQTITA